MAFRLRTALSVLACGLIVAVAAAAGPGAGGLIAFSRCRLPDSCEAGADIWVMTPDASRLQRLTREGTHNDSPAWSPDGKRIAFVSGRNGKDTIWTMRADGTQMRRVTYPTGLDEQPAWSPDGRRVVFIRQVSQRDRGLYVVGADGRGLRKLTHLDGEYEHPSWSPDGRRICFAYARNSSRDHFALYVANADGSGRQKLSRTARGDYRDPIWAPDGKRIAFSLLVPSGKAFAAHLEVMNADGSGERVVLRAPANTVYFSPSWSPDGRTIAFVTLTNTVRQGRISYVGADGRRFHKLLHLQGDNRAPSWQALPRN